MQSKKPRNPILPVTLSPDVLREFEKIANAEHMEPTRFAALIISKFSDVKQGHGLSALAGIPKENFKLRPGRTPTSSSDADIRLVGSSV